jgi:excisionase family DNA binding protein
MTKRKTESTERPLLYSPLDAAALMGLSRATVYRMLDDGELVAIHAGRTGKAIRITRASIDEWLADRLAERPGAA